MRLTGVSQWPASFGLQHFTVTTEIVIGKDGHVASAHGVSGPAEGYKACEESVKKWVFAPYLVLGKPVEVETKIMCSNNYMACGLQITEWPGIRVLSRGGMRSSTADSSPKVAMQRVDYRHLVGLIDINRMSSGSQFLGRSFR